MTDNERLQLANLLTFAERSYYDIDKNLAELKNSMEIIKQLVSDNKKELF